MSVPPGRAYRRENIAECKRLARLARSRTGVKFDAIADVLCVSPSYVDHQFDYDTGTQLGYADLFLLARAPETADLCRELLAPLLEIVDRQSLRLRDLEGLAATSTGREAALAILKSTAERIAPVENRSDTAVGDG